ncbi:MAG TPA: alternative ribosome rescue aminoacyl-tRNA hydrolase ArfB [Vicinamibacterales bacterium]|nr:alternative ribosome rescue aminoacyl-tRNA hydrolase ArfB [Vicinamibacterales bacterium]
MPLEITPSLFIDDSEIEERFVRASGPGGQNVNKVSTAVQLRFDVGRSRTLSDETRARLRTIAGSRMTDEDVLLIDARAHRTQGQNREEARERLAEFIRRALIRPKRRQKTRPGAAAKQRRLDTKKIRAKTKQGRGKLRGEE